jgi:GNAT superfamily N-acetyltransferase
MESRKPVVVECKQDFELSNREIKGIFAVYNECFYDNRIVSRKEEEIAKDWIGKFKTFEWYFIKMDGNIVAIGNFVTSYENSEKFAFNAKLGENVTSIGVREKYRRLGLGKKIMEEIIKNLGGDNHLVVDIQLASPLKTTLLYMYRKLGFVVDLKQDEENIYIARKKGKDVGSK